MYALEEHTGELAIRLKAESVTHLFEEAGRALAEVMGGRQARGTGEYQRVTLEAPDREALLVAWLDELVFLSERDKQLFGDLRIDALADRALSARVRGEPANALKTQVKAATFHGLKIVEGPEGVSATVVLDV